MVYRARCHRRRITELYTKAVDQLGSDQAAVRLGGLYALERLAKTTPTQQVTIINVICAYLRMPYANPPALKSGATEDDRKEHDRLVQERETRQTALDILTRHDPQEREVYWRAQRIRLQRANLAEAALHKANLTGAYLNDATLIEADLTGADLAEADLNGANLTDADLVLQRQVVMAASGVVADAGAGLACSSPVGPVHDVMDGVDNWCGDPVP